MSKGKSELRRPGAKQHHSRCNTVLTVAAALAFVAAPGYLQIAHSQQAAPVSAAPALVATAASERSLLDQYCVTCHNKRLQTAGLSLDQLDVSQMRDHAEVWEKV